MDAGEKVFAIDGAPLTVRLALAPAVLAPAFVVVRAPAAIVLLYVPGVELVTFTVTVHEPLAGMVPPLNATLVPLFAAVTVPAPLAGTVPVACATLPPPLAAVTLPPAHVVAPLALAVLTRFAGYVSVNAAPVTADAFGLVSVMVSTLVSPVPIELGENAFATVRP